MRALILAAGRGSRLGEISMVTPKCLQQVGPEAILDRLVGQLLEAGVESMLINTHHLANEVNEHVAGSVWAERATLVYEDELLGTLGTLRANSDFFLGEPAWVLHADNFIEGSLRPLLDTFVRRGPGVWGSVLTFESDRPSSCGVFELDDEAVVIGFHEKVPRPPGRTANGATYIFDTHVFRLISELPPEATDISQHLLPRLSGHIVAVPAQGQLIDIGTPEGLESARRAHSSALSQVTPHLSAASE